MALVDRPRIKSLLGITGIFVALAGLLIAIWANFLRPHVNNESQPGPSLPAVSPKVMTSDSQQPSRSDGASAIGQCFTNDWGLTGCDVTHHWELIKLGPPCGSAEVNAYLGGVAGLDVINPAVRPATRTIDGQDGCFLGLPGGGALQGSVRDVLHSSQGDRWRRCIDNRAAREVTCAEPHTTEVVGQPVTGDLSCPAQADAYAETALARFGLDLAVGAEGPEGGQQCVVEVRGENVLLRSVRHLGSGALPIESR